MRAVAVVGVMFVHFDQRWLLPGGGFGVDVFFVLSGFLITSLLIGEWDNGGGRIRFRNFYARRALRLFPALGCTIVLAVALAVIFGGAIGHATLVGLPWVLLYVGNWARAFNNAALGSLGHTWSLAIEEQFYLLWPAMFVCISRRGFRRDRVALSLALLAVTVMIYRVVLGVLRYQAYRISNGTDTHCDGLLIGCAVAFWLTSDQSQRIHPWIRRGLKGATWLAAATIVAIFLLEGAHVELTYPAVVLSAGVLLVGLVIDAPTRLERVLSSRSAVWIGRRSYGLYLWHYVIYVGIPWPHFHWPLNVVDGGAKFAASFVVAAISYRFIELPALRLKSRFRGDEALPRLLIEPTAP